MSVAENLPPTKPGSRSTVKSSIMRFSQGENSLDTKRSWKPMGADHLKSTDSRKSTTSPSTDTPVLKRSCAVCQKRTEGWGRVTETNGTQVFVCGKACQEAFNVRQKWARDNNQGE